MGHGYKGGAWHYHSVSENISSTAEKFRYHNGYFGTSSPDSKSRNRNIKSDDPVKTAREFYNLISRGGKEEPMKNGKGMTCRLADETIISYREVSSSDGTPVVDINISRSNNSGGLRRQKIHFIRKED